MRREGREKPLATVAAAQEEARRALVRARFLSDVAHLIEEEYICNGDEPARRRIWIDGHRIDVDRDLVAELLVVVTLESRRRRQILKAKVQPGTPGMAPLFEALPSRDA